MVLVSSRVQAASFYLNLCGAGAVRQPVRSGPNCFEVEPWTWNPRASFVGEFAVNKEPSEYFIWCPTCSSLDLTVLLDNVLDSQNISQFANTDVHWLRPNFRFPWTNLPAAILHLRATNCHLQFHFVQIYVLDSYNAGPYFESSAKVFIFLSVALMFGLQPILTYEVIISAPNVRLYSHWKPA